MCNHLLCQYPAESPPGTEGQRKEGGRTGMGGQRL